MARFRLRFLLQELDLTGAEVIIGRSPDCQITIEDPLVSRQHARITIADGEARIVDLGSRNGVRVNGVLTRGETTLLKHNDRVRLGTQDLVFLVVEENAARVPRSTGYMMHCKSCGRPFPGGPSECPHCGERFEAEGEGVYDTMTGIVGAPQTSWTFQLLGEVIDRAILAGRAPEAERMFQRAATEVDERVRGGATVDIRQLAMMGLSAMRLAKLQGLPKWALWALKLFRAQGVMPARDMLDELAGLDPASFSALRAELNLLAAWWQGSRAQFASADERALGALLLRLAGAHPAGP